MIGEFATKLGIAKAAKTGHRDDRACAIAGISGGSATGPRWRRTPGRCRCISSTRRARSASRRSAAATGGCRPIRSRSACRSRAPTPSILDITTSTVAEGKLMVALNKGEQVPEGWIVDRDGTPTTDPKDFYDGGALLTDRRAQGLGTVDPHRSPRRRGHRPAAARIPTDTILRNNMLSIYIAPAVYDPDRRCARGGDALRRLRQGVAARRSRASRCWRPAMSNAATRAARHGGRRPARRQDLVGPALPRRRRSASTKGDAAALASVNAAARRR